MTNSSTKYGVFNKQTAIYSQIDDGSTAFTTFSTVAEAKAFFFTDAALALFDECCTQLQWALEGTTALKRTMAFGTKGGNIAPADDWAEQYLSRFNNLTLANNYGKTGYNVQIVDTHLF